MKKLFPKCLVALSLLSFSTIIYARPYYVNGIAPKASGQHKDLAGCVNPVSQINLDVNNVRALLMDAGDMWYDMAKDKAAYVVPKAGQASSLFAGSVWIGGNSAGTRKVAAQMYRQNGTDYWSGPLDNSAAITAADCALWDKMWKINKSDVSTFRAIYGSDTGSKIAQDISNKISLVPKVIREWPARGNAEAVGNGGMPLTMGTTKNYADFVDVDNDGLYNFRKGDYPKIMGDQYIWWVFNDMGNTKTMSKSQGIGLEIQTGAFAFATADCLNESTFYNYRVINRGSNTLDSTYMATFTDADLGNAIDDYVGCDVSRGLGILYNGDGFDEGANGYGYDIPMVAVDFFIGPKRIIKHPAPQKYDTVQLQMTNFSSFTGNGSTNPNNSDPTTAAGFYNLMTGKDQAGDPYTLSCSGLDPAAPKTPYVFPETMRECGSPCNNTPGDRRFVHSSGPFILYPDAVNDITIGVVWVPSVGGNCPSFGKIQVCDDKAQQLFDDSFKLKLGPEAPDLITKPYDRKVVFYLNNPYGSNNFNESYGNLDSAGVDKGKYIEYSSKAKKLFYSADSSTYKFQGYVVYQLKNSSVSLSAIRKSDGSVNTDNAKIAFQCDKKDNITKVFNFAKDPNISNDYYIPNLMIVGSDSGIKNNFVLNQDLFSDASDKTMVNYKTYYYVAIAYAYNNFKKFDFSDPSNTQDIQYLESRVNGREGPIAVIEVTPTPAYDVLYTNNGATYGDGIVIKRLEGTGNDGIALDLTTSSENEAMNSPYQAYFPTYKPNAGPVAVKITAPDSVKAGNYEIYLDVKAAYDNTYPDTTRGVKGDSTRWHIVRTSNTGVSDTMYSTGTILNYNEQLLVKWGAEINPIENWGMSVAVNQQKRPGDYGTTWLNNGLITSTAEYVNPSYPWLSGIVDANTATSGNNWIRGGTQTYLAADKPYNGCNMNDLSPKVDTIQSYNKVLGGTWAPYALTSGSNANKDAKCGFGLKWRDETNSKPLNPLKAVPSVDIVFTSDRSKWTRCSVIEMNDGASSGTVANNSEGLALKFNLRKHASLEKNADSYGNPVYNTSGDSSHSWFPGYAINQETGERLNIVFGEDSWDKADNGNDMLFNPTPTQYDPIDNSLRWGGRHVVYISRTKYDADGGADYIYNALKSLDAQQKLDVYNKMVWCSPTLLQQGFKFNTYGQGLIPSDVRLRLRVTKPYANYVPQPGQTLKNGGYPLYSFNTTDIAPKKLDDAGNIYYNDDKALLDNIGVVPNPYMAYSTYETSRLDNRVKIVNLPAVASIHIYSTDGTLIRTLTKSDAATTFIDWDLKNEKSIPIASGMYLIHVKIKTDTGDKETVLKFFGVMRPTDITQF